MYSGPRTRSDKVYQRGPGVAAALLIRHTIPVVSQRDYKTLGHIAYKLGAGSPPSPDLKDHHEIDWYRDYFQADTL
jgi:hypothetical protein